MPADVTLETETYQYFFGMQIDDGNLTLGVGAASPYTVCGDVYNPLNDTFRKFRGMAVIVPA